MSPVAKGRPKISTFGGFVRAITPKKTREAEINLKAQIAAQLEEKRRKGEDTSLMVGAVHIDIFVRKLRPASAPKKKPYYPCKRPDIDNYVKLVFDAMNGLVWKDDGQVIRLIANKGEADIPGYTITVEEVA
jgi:Holliday junction resolvase RusA-like endonuclease